MRLRFDSGPWATFRHGKHVPNSVAPGETFEVSDEAGAELLADHPGCFTVVMEVGKAPKTAAVLEAPKARAVKPEAEDEADSKPAPKRRGRPKKSTKAKADK